MQLKNTKKNSLLRFQGNAFNIRLPSSWKSSSYKMDQLICVLMTGKIQTRDVTLEYNGYRVVTKILTKGST